MTRLATTTLTALCALLLALVAALGYGTTDGTATAAAPGQKAPAAGKVAAVAAEAASDAIGGRGRGPTNGAGDPGPTGEAEVSEAADETGFVPGEVVVTVAGEAEPQTVEISPDVDPEAVAELLEERPGIEDASANYVAHTSGWRPNDPGVNLRRRGRAGGWVHKQWNFLPCSSFCHRNVASTGPRSRGGMNVIRAWQHLRRAGRPGAAGVKVAVLDTGIAYRDYGRRFRRNPELARKRFLPGYDFVEKDRIPLDRNGHGTHVASTIAQTTNNRKGLTGIAFRAKLIPVRVMDANGRGTTANIAAGIRWAANQGARVASMSLNFDCGVSIPAIERALKYAHRKGVILVGSSGNRSAQDCPSLPATAPQVISVGGTTESGCVATYSFNSDAIDIAAPGGGANQAGCPHTSRNRPILQVGMIGGEADWFGIEPGWVGTSMAAAHVAGAAAAVLASRVLTGKRGPSQVRQRLLGTARLPEFAAGQPQSGFGAGIINLGKAVNPKFRLP